MSVVIELAGIDELSAVERTRIACAIIGAVDETHLSALDSVTVLEEDRFEGWVFGEPCPACGSERVTVLEVSDEWYVSGDGETAWTSGGEMAGYHIDVQCGRCDRTLYQHPASALIEAG